MPRTFGVSGRRECCAHVRSGTTILQSANTGSASLIAVFKSNYRYIRKLPSIGGVYVDEVMRRMQGAADEIAVVRLSPLRLWLGVAGADTIRSPAHSPIQSICRWPCIRTARSLKRCNRRRNQFPLIKAVPMRSESAFAALGYSTTWWWRAMIHQACGY
jgi:hypothetical protein